MKSLLRQTKVIATIGPATEKEETLEQLIKEGVDVCRLNMAHADHDWVREISSKIRSIGARLSAEPAIMMDVKGPEIRTGFLDKPIELKKDQTVELSYGSPSTQKDGKDGPIRIQVSYEKLTEHLQPGGTVLLDNGLISLEVVEKSEGVIRCAVLQDCSLGSRRHVNLPGIETDLPSVTQKTGKTLWSGSSANTTTSPSPLPGTGMPLISSGAFFGKTIQTPKSLPKSKTSKE